MLEKWIDISAYTKENAIDAWRNDQEKESMLKWNLTAETYMHTNDWVKLFKETGYTKDYYWFIAA